MLIVADLPSPGTLGQSFYSRCGFPGETMAHRRAVVVLAFAVAVAPSGTLAQASDAASPADARPHVIRLKGGGAFKGTVVGQDERRITLREASGQLRELPRSAIASIELEGAASESSPAKAPVLLKVGCDAPAAPAAPEKAGTIGLGAASSGAILVPIDVGGHLRLEPELAVVSRRPNRIRLTSWVAGSGVFFVLRHGPQFLSYVGPRFSVLSEAYLIEDSLGIRSDRVQRLLVALAGGGEWLAVPWFGLGAEARMSLSVGLGGGSGPGDVDASAALVARVHFP